MYKEALEPVIAHFTSDRYVPEFTKAKDEYFKRTGKIFDDDPAYETRMTSFMEWYLFDRYLVDVGIPPIRLYYLLFRDSLTPQQRIGVERFQTTHLSLFEIVLSTPETLKVKDIWTGKLHGVPQKGLFGAVEKGDILDSRLIPFDEMMVLSDALWLHPKEVRAMILRQLEDVRGKGGNAFTAFLFDLAYRKLKRDRYKHLEAIEVYRSET